MQDIGKAWVQCNNRKEKGSMLFQQKIEKTALSAEGTLVPDTRPHWLRTSKCKQTTNRSFNSLIKINNNINVNSFSRLRQHSFLLCNKILNHCFNKINYIIQNICLKLVSQAFVPFLETNLECLKMKRSSFPFRLFVSFDYMDFNEFYPNR